MPSFVPTKKCDALIICGSFSVLVSMFSCLYVSATAETASKHPVVARAADAPGVGSSSANVNDEKAGASKPADNKSVASEAKKDSKEATNAADGKKDDPGAPAQAPITGFHPIKKAMRPVENLEGLSVKLEQQIIKLQGPLLALQAPMGTLRNRMDSVDEGLDGMQTQLFSMRDKVRGVRSDLRDLRAEIQDLKGPVVALEKPIASVSRPMLAVNTKLTYILMSVIAAAVAIAFGMPFVAYLLFRSHLQHPDAAHSHSNSSRDVSESVA